MKKLLLLIAFCTVLLNAFAQDTVKKASKIGEFNEEFSVLKSNKKMRQGNYQLFYQKKLAAVGKYSEGKRSGVWNFYNNDKLIQQYDYTAGKMIFSEPEKELSYTITANDGQKVINPVAIGGVNAALRFIASYIDYSSALSEFKGKVLVIHSIDLDETGTLVKWTTVAKGSDGIKVINPSIEDVPHNIVIFTPAMVNGNNVSSVISFQDGTKLGGARQEPVITTERKTVTTTMSVGRGRQ